MKKSLLKLLIANSLCIGGLSLMSTYATSSVCSSSSMTNKEAFSKVEEFLDNEIIPVSNAFESNDIIVATIDNILKYQNKTNHIMKVSANDLISAYTKIFNEKKFNCRVSTVYIANELNKLGIESRVLEIHSVKKGDIKSHSVPIYKIGSKWYVIDIHFKKFKYVNIEEFLKNYIKLINNTSCVFLTYELSDNRASEIIDLGQLIPKVNDTLIKNKSPLFVDIEITENGDGIKGKQIDRKNRIMLKIKH